MTASTLNVTEVKEARRLAWLGEEIRAIAITLGHGYTGVWNAVRGRSWSTVRNPPPVPTAYATVDFRVCINENCGDLYQGYPKDGLCPACYSYAYRNDGELRGSRRIPLGRQPMDIGDLDALYERYLRGESTDAIAEDLDCAPETLRRRFRIGGYEMRENVTRVLTEAEVVQARVMHYEDGTPISEIAEYLGHNYMTVLDAVQWRTWRTAGGPMPELEPEQMHACERCGVQTRHERLCRYCREEVYA